MKAFVLRIFCGNALSRKLDIAMAAAEQSDIVFLLQFADLIRDRRLGEIERERRFREPAGHRDLVESTELDIAHGGQSLGRADAE